MSSYQYAHLECYSRAGSKSKQIGSKKTSKKWSVAEIIAETLRHEGNCPHIKNPQPPTLLFGVKPTEIPAIVDEYAETIKDPMGRKLRADGLCLLAGIASLPREMEESHLQEWLDLNLEYLKEKYGDRLKSVVMHNDESHPHIHFYVVPRHGEKFEEVHEGLKAQKQARTITKNIPALMQAYREAMRGYQDEYNAKVGIHLGLMRLGPGRRRLPTAEWKAEKKQAAYFANAKAVAKDGHRKGYKEGKKQALEEANKAGVQIASGIKSLLGGLHTPTAEVLAELEAEKIAREKLEQQHATEKKQLDNKYSASLSKSQKQFVEVSATLKATTEDLKRAQLIAEKAHELAEYYKQQLKPAAITPSPHSL